MTPEERNDLERLAKRIVKAFDEGVVYKWAADQFAHADATQLSRAYLSLLEENVAQADELAKAKDERDTWRLAGEASSYAALEQEKELAKLETIARVRTHRSKGCWCEVCFESEHSEAQVIEQMEAELAKLRKVVAAGDALVTKVCLNNRHEVEDLRRIGAEVKAYDEARASQQAEAPAPAKEKTVEPKTARDEFNCAQCLRRVWTGEQIGTDRYGRSLCGSCSEKAPAKEEPDCARCGDTHSVYTTNDYGHCITVPCPECSSKEEPKPEAQNVITGPGFYKTRDGRQAEVTGQDGPLNYPWSGEVDDSAYSWKDDGAFTGEPEGLDIIGPWTEPEAQEPCPGCGDKPFRVSCIRCNSTGRVPKESLPPGEPEAQPSPAFKVGQEVRVKASHNHYAGKTGIVSQDAHAELRAQTEVHLDAPFRIWRWFNTEDLEPFRPSAPEPAVEPAVEPSQPEPELPGELWGLWDDRAGLWLWRTNFILAAFTSLSALEMERRNLQEPDRWRPIKLWPREATKNERSIIGLEADLSQTKGYLCIANARIAELEKLVNSQAERIHKQAELLSKRAEKPSALSDEDRCCLIRGTQAVKNEELDFETFAILCRLALEEDQTKGATP